MVTSAALLGVKASQHFRDFALFLYHFPSQKCKFCYFPVLSTNREPNICTCVLWDVENYCLLYLTPQNVGFVYPTPS